MSGVVLRISGSKVAVERFLSQSRWRPAAIFWKGKPRLPSSTHLSVVNGFNLSVSDAPGDRLDLAIANTKRFLKREAVDLRRLKRLKLGAVLDFGVHAKGDAVVSSYAFDSAFLSQLVKAHVALEVSHYEGRAETPNKSLERTREG
jgi:hypothetical protein